MSASAKARAPLDVFLVAGEASADALGASLMQALRLRHGPVSFRGVGGPLMAEAGLQSLFPMQDLTAIGLAPILAKLPTILRRLRETVNAVVARPPDVLLLIDAPDFTHRVADRVRRRLPHLPIIKYVSPTVWVWRPGRARAMRRSIDLVLALLPFEPDVHRTLGGPPCVYVGHPLLEQLDTLRASAGGPQGEDNGTSIVVLPGSRRQEIRRLMPVFGETLARVAAERGTLAVTIPTLAHLREEVTALAAGWSVPPRIVTEAAEKHAAFRRGRAALAASGTVTLELALAGLPHVAAYRIPLIEGLIVRAVIRVNSVILANLVLGENVVPEFLQRRCTADRIAPALSALIGETPARARQLAAFARLDGILGAGGLSPSLRAADAVLDHLRGRSEGGGASRP